MKSLETCGTTNAKTKVAKPSWALNGKLLAY